MHVRPARPSDYDGYARLFPLLEVPDPVPSAEKFTGTLMPDSLVAVDGDALVGVVWARRRGDRLHVVHLIFDGAKNSLGVGRAQMDAAAERARSLDLTRWSLNVKPENVAARSLYEAVGMAETMRSVSLRFAWEALERLPQSSPDAVVATLADDERYEGRRALGLVRGELAAMRAPPGRVFFGVDLRGAPAGVGAFDAAFPGASPFRLSDPLHARALLSSMRPAREARLPRNLRRGRRRRSNPRSSAQAEPPRCERCAWKVRFQTRAEAVVAVAAAHERQGPPPDRVFDLVAMGFIRR